MLLAQPFQCFGAEKASTFKTEGTRGDFVLLIHIQFSDHVQLAICVYSRANHFQASGSGRACR